MDVILIILGLKESRAWSGVIAAVWLVHLVWVWKYPAWPAFLSDFTNHPHRTWWIAFSAWAFGVQFTRFLGEYR